MDSWLSEAIDDLEDELLFLEGEVSPATGLSAAHVEAAVERLRVVAADLRKLAAVMRLQGEGMARRDADARKVERRRQRRQKPCAPVLNLAHEIEKIKKANAAAEVE